MISKIEKIKDTSVNKFQEEFEELKLTQLTIPRSLIKMNMKVLIYRDVFRK